MSPFSRSLLCVFALAALAAAGSAAADPKADILAGHAKMVEAGKFRTHSTTVSAGKTSEGSTETQWPDRFHVRSEGGEFIILPGKTFMKQGGQWTTFPMDMSAMIKSMTPDAIKQGYDNMTNIKELPAEDVAGKPARVFEYDTTATVMGIKADSHVRLWITTDDGRIVKQHIDATAMGNASTTETTYEYDPAIEIKAPL